MKTPSEKRRGAACTDDAGANDGDAANGHVCDMSLRRRRCQSGYPARVEEIAFTGSIEPRRVDRARKVGHEHAIVWNVQRDGNSLHETGHYDLRLGRRLVVVQARLTVLPREGRRGPSSRETGS